MFPFRSSCFITLSITILNKVEDGGSPCLTPETILNSFANWLPICTFAIELLRVSPIAFINFFGTSYLVRHSITLFLFTESNAWEYFYKYIVQLYVVFITLFEHLSYHEDVMDGGSVRSEAHLKDS